jgi:putative oxidoreductase
MIRQLRALTDLYDRSVHAVTSRLDSWFLGLAARLVFAAVLLPYYLNSAMTKFDGLFSISDSAYYQIALPAVDAAGGDVSAVAVFPWGLMVVFGTYGEAILPVLVVLGLFTRIAAFGMIGFILVQSLTDILVHKVEASTVGALFDRFPDSVILDQRLLWIFPLLYLAVKGAGFLSLDKILCTLWTRRMRGPETQKGGRPSPTAFNISKRALLSSHALRSPSAQPRQPQLQSRCGAASSLPEYCAEDRCAATRSSAKRR